MTKRVFAAVLVLLAGVYPTAAAHVEPPDIQTYFDGQPVQPDATDNISVESKTHRYQFPEGDTDAKGRFNIHNDANRTYVIKATVVPITDDGFAYNERDRTISVTVPPNSEEMIVKKWVSTSNVEASFAGFELRNIRVCNQAWIGTDCVSLNQ